MRYHALAADYDGTLAHNGRVNEPTLAARDDASTAALGEWLRGEGSVWASSSTWHGRTVVRFAVSNRGTDAAAVRRTVDAVARGAAALGISR